MNKHSAGDGSDNGWMHFDTAAMQLGYANVQGLSDWKAWIGAYGMCGIIEPEQIKTVLISRYKI